MSDIMHTLQTMRTRAELARAPTKVAERAAKTKRQKANPDDTVRAWVGRQDNALSRILRAASQGASAAANKARNAAIPDHQCLWWQTNDRASRAADDEIYFEILDTVGRAAEAAAARAAGFSTWDEFKQAGRLP
jgi:hypothetical protein